MALSGGLAGHHGPRVVGDIRWVAKEEGRHDELPGGARLGWWKRIRWYEPPKTVKDGGAGESSSLGAVETEKEDDMWLGCVHWVRLRWAALGDYSFIIVQASITTEIARCELNTIQPKSLFRQRSLWIQPGSRNHNRN